VVLQYVHRVVKEMCTEWFKVCVPTNATVCAPSGIKVCALSGTTICAPSGIKVCVCRLMLQYVH